MITIISYVSKDFNYTDKMPEGFASLLLDYIKDENVLVGSKMFMQDLVSLPFLRSNTFVLSRSKKFTKVKTIKKPEHFKEGVVLGGRSTIASMLPYADCVILGIDDNTSFGTSFPAMNSFKAEDELNCRGYKIVTYTR